MFTHDRVTDARQVTAVGDEGDDTCLGVLGDAPLGQANETDVQVVQQLFFDAPAFAQASFVWGDQGQFFRIVGHVGEAGVRRIADHNHDLAVVFNLVGQLLLFSQLAIQGVGFGFARFPAVEAIGEVHADALIAVEGCARFAEQQGQLQVGDGEGSGHQFEAVNTGLESFFQPGADAPFAFFLHFGGQEAAQFQQVASGARGGIENGHIRVEQA